MLLQEDFILCEPIRSPETGVNPSGATLATIGKPNVSSAGGLLFDSQAGNMFRTTLPQELNKTESAADEDDNYEKFVDSKVISAVTQTVEYHNFVDYMKFYVFNDAQESLPESRLAFTGMTRATREGVPNICKHYVAIGFTDESDYQQRDQTVDFDDDFDIYPDGDVECFPRKRMAGYAPATPSATLIGTKISKSTDAASSLLTIAKVGHGTSDATQIPPSGPHKVVRAITFDNELFAQRKKVIIEWTGTADDRDLYVFGEHNGVLAIGKVAIAGDGAVVTEADRTVKHYTDDTAITFTRIYSIAVVDEGETVECWNDVNKGTLACPDVNLTVKYTLPDAADAVTKHTWSTIYTNHAFSLTFHDEAIFDYKKRVAMILSVSPDGSSGPSTMRHTYKWYDSELVEQDEDLVYAQAGEFDEVDSDFGTLTFTGSADHGAFADVQIGDHVILVDGAGDTFSAGYVTSIGSGPDTLTVSMFDAALTTETLPLAGTVSVVRTKYGRVGLWLRREYACQDDNPQTTDTDFFFRIYGNQPA